MNKQKRSGLPHRSWFLPHTCRAVDIQSVAVALAFLVVVAMSAGGPGEKTAEKNERQAQPDVSAQVDVRSLSKASPESDRAAPAQSMTGVRQLEDPRRGK